MNAPFIVPTRTSASCGFDALPELRVETAVVVLRARTGTFFLATLLRFLLDDLLRVELAILRSPNSTELFRRPLDATPDNH
jgi:hypothetical protein